MFEAVIAGIAVFVLAAGVALVIQSMFGPFRRTRSNSSTGDSGVSTGGWFSNNDSGSDSSDSSDGCDGDGGD